MSSVRYKDFLEFHDEEISDIDKYHWLNISIKFHNVTLMKDLITSEVCVNFPPNVPSDADFSPLHNCVEYNLLGVPILVDAGANVNIRALKDYKPTPIHQAIVRDNLPMVKMLLAHGADPYCLIHGLRPVLNKPFSWDCFVMAKVFENEEVISFFSGYKLFEEDKLKLSHLYWRGEPKLLDRMHMPAPTAVYLNEKIFIGDRRWWDYHQFLCVFDVVSRKWSKLPFHDSREMGRFTLAVMHNRLYTLGGHLRKDAKEEEYSNKVFSLDDDFKWSDTHPPLNVGRVHATSTSFDSFILVAGGSDRNGWLSSVEVMNSSQSSSTWWEICDLPVKSGFMQCTVTHDELFIGCGVGTKNLVYTAELSTVKGSLNVVNDSQSNNSSPESFWQPLPKTPLKQSGLVSVNNCLLTVGGLDDGNQSHPSVYTYDCYKGRWTKVCDVGKQRYRSAVVVCTSKRSNALFILGDGWDAEASVESCELL